MSVKHQSISQRIAKNIPADEKRKVANDWAQSWDNEQTKLIDRLGIAVRDDDYDTTCICIGELRAVSTKRMSALVKVLVILLETTGN